MKTCENCKWHEQETVTMGWVCVNPKSKRCTEFTMKYDACRAWEGWTKEEIKKGYERVIGVLNNLMGMEAGK